MCDVDVECAFFGAVCAWLPNFTLTIQCDIVKFIKMFFPNIFVCVVFTFQINFFHILCLVLVASKVVKIIYSAMDQNFVVISQYFISWHYSDFSRNMKIFQVTNGVP